MIIAKIYGGLGNQLFQYAVGKSLSIHNNTELELDIKWYDENKERKFLLNNFNIDVKIASDSLIRKFYSNSSNKLFKKLLKTIKERNGYKIYQEKAVFKFDSEILKKNKNIYLNGYWQNEKYFRKIQ